MAQDGSRRLDSLSRVAHVHSNDSTGVLACADLCYEYRFVNQDSAMKFGWMGISLGKRLNFKTGLAQVYSDAATIHYDRGNLDSAAILWESALNLRTELQDRPRVASLQMKIGAVYFRRGLYDNALRYQLQALRQYEELQLSQGIGQALNNVAAVYQHQNDLGNALRYYENAYDLHKKNDQLSEMGTALINIGNVYFLRKDYTYAKQCYLKALRLLPEDQQPSNKAIALNNLSEIHTVGNRFDSAAYYSGAALSLRKQIGDAAGIISSLGMMGRLQSRMKRYAVADRYLQEALRLATEKEILYEQGRIYENLYQLYRDQGAWKKSLNAHVQYAAIKDSLLNEAGRKEVAALQVRYETDKKEQQIALQSADLSEKQLRIERDATVIAGMALTFVLCGVIFFLLRNRQRRKTEMERKENEIALREAYIRATIESQENERKRFARDLHDGMGQWISSLRLSLTEIHSARTDEQKLEILERSERIMTDINSEFRSIAFNLMPHTLIHYGLTAALGEMVRRLNSMSQCVFSMTAFGFPERLRELEEISLYRVVQEWTNNVLKHSDATRAEIQLTGHEDELLILIEDNGNGFEIKRLVEGSGNGWKNIQSRLNLIRGTADVDSSPGRQGTTITLTVPIAAALRDINITVDSATSLD